MNFSLLDTAVQQFLQDNLEADLTRLALKPSPFAQVSARELAEQISGKRIAEKKLPSWYRTAGIIYPPKLALEQCSSEATAGYKSRLIRGKRVLDLTGGFGVDSFFFAQTAEQVTHLEPQESLSEIAKHNAAMLGRPNLQFVQGYAEKFLDETTEKWDTIYLDPSRRVAGQKVFRLADCEPNVVDLQAKLFSLSRYILLKTAPLLDIRSALTEITQVSEVHVLSVNNEVKELLFLLDREFQGQEPQIHCAGLSGDKEQHYAFKLSDEKACELRDYAPIGQYVYEPDTAWLKAGCFKLISRDYQLGKLHQHTHLYTSEQLVENFPGRTFRILKNQPYKNFAKEKQHLKANVLTRNFPVNTPELQKKHRISDGGTWYLIACTDLYGELRILEAERV